MFFVGFAKYSSSLLSIVLSYRYESNDILNIMLAVLRAYIALTDSIAMLCCIYFMTR